MKIASGVKKYPEWSTKEIQMLKRLYPMTPLKKLVNMFPCRTKGALVYRAYKLSVPSPKLWQPRENQVLEKYFDSASPQKLIELLSKRRSWGSIRAQGERLNLKRNVHKPRREVREDYFQKWSPNMAYLLGFTYSDGCIIKGTYKGYGDALKFGVHKRDLDILKKIKNELHSHHKISKVKEAVHLSINSQKIVNNLKALGVSYRKSLRENLPNIPSKYIMHFIRGIVDGDGGVSIDKKGYPNINVCGGETIISFIRDHFLLQLGVYSKVSRAQYSQHKKLYLTYIAYRCNSAKKILGYLYNSAPLYLKRKYQLARRCLKLKIKHKKNFLLTERGVQQFYTLWR